MLRLYRALHRALYRYYRYGRFRRRRETPEQTAERLLRELRHRESLARSIVARR